MPGASDAAASPQPASIAVRAAMQAQVRAHTRPEVALRKVLFSRGLRYRVQLPVPGLPRRTMDIAFTKAKVAVFVDGCFWHGCPVHGVAPKNNAEWWVGKLSANRARDAGTDAHLTRLGWIVFRVWEHESPMEVAGKIVDVVRSRGLDVLPAVIDREHVQGEESASNVDIQHP